MSFDLSRVRFDARKDFLGVIMQQGRVQLDSDWNEWVAQVARRLQAGTLDTFNGDVVPRITPDGFRIEADGGDLTIGPGRIYVDGLLAENHGGDPDAWDPLLAELTGTEPIDYTEQPYYPDAPDLPGDGQVLVYVDVWQRDVTHHQDPDLLEKAVGVDTTGRRQTVWQVKWLQTEGDLTCSMPDENIPEYVKATASAAARLSTDTGDPDFEPDPCLIPPAAGYRGYENQLYRVQVHKGGAPEEATFKWSRDNGSVVSRATHINPARDRVTVESIGRDDVLRFHDGDWVEVTDDWRELHGLAGELRRIKPAGGVDETARTLEFDAALSGGLFPTNAQQETDPDRHTIVRRWDQAGKVRREDGTEVTDLDVAGSDGDILIPVAGTRLFLEHGILVDFDLEPGDGEFRPGDHWVFAARSVDASIEVLDRAPPLGVHHHYARLAIVNFPDNETDCRTLWPPLSQPTGGEGESCDCTVCVTAEGHNSGEATIQQAIDAIKDTGGTICLGIGDYSLRQPLSVIDASSLRIRGQGNGTRLVPTRPGNVLTVSGSRNVALENFTAVGTASNESEALVVLHNTRHVSVERITLLAFSLTDFLPTGIGVTGFLENLLVSDCAIMASHAVGRVEALGSAYAFTYNMNLTRNVFFSDRRAIRFDLASLHYGRNRIEGNLIAAERAGMVLTGAAVPGFPMAISDNIIFTRGDGIRAGLDDLAIERNDILGDEEGERSGNGIEILEGLSPDGVDRLRICDNRLGRLRGNGLVVSTRVNRAIIRDNMIQGMGGGALVMGATGSADLLRFVGNQCTELGLLDPEENVAFAALQLTLVERGDVLDNIIAEVGRTMRVGAGIDGLRGLGMGQVRIAGNRFHGIGPDRFAAPINAINLLAPFGRVAIDDNTVNRVGEKGDGLQLTDWRAINIGVTGRDTPNHAFAVAYVAGEDAGYLLSANRAARLVFRNPAVSIRGNQLHGVRTRVPLNACAGLESCLFSENHCQLHDGDDSEPPLGDLAARTVTATHNRLINAGKLSLQLAAQVERAIVIGNTSTRDIKVLGGSPVPPDIHLTNIIGV